jgi:beta-glucosidase
MEMQATGVGWTFATTLAVPQDIRWGRTHEGYGRDPALVSRLGAALVEGLQGRSRTDCTVLGCAKHFVGDGATSWGTVRRNEAARWWDGWGENWKIDQGDA